MWKSKLKLISKLLLLITLTAFSVQAHTVTLTWNPSTAAGVNYNIYRGTASGQETATPINSAPVALNCTSPSNCTYQDSNVVAGQTYFYYVEAYLASNPAGFQSSVPSNEIKETIPVNPVGGLVIITNSN